MSGAFPRSVGTVHNAVWRSTEDRAIATVLAGIRNKHATPPRQKGAILPEDLIAMLETLDRGTLRGFRINLTKASGP